jgi:hypothetical protein
MNPPAEPINRPNVHRSVSVSQPQHDLHSSKPLSQSQSHAHRSASMNQPGHDFHSSQSLSQPHAQSQHPLLSRAQSHNSSINTSHFHESEQLSRNVSHTQPNSDLQHTSNEQSQSNQRYNVQSMRPDVDEDEHKYDDSQPFYSPIQRSDEENAYLDSVQWGRKKRGKAQQSTNQSTNRTVKKEYRQQIIFPIRVREVIRTLVMPAPSDLSTALTHHEVAIRINSEFPEYKGHVQKTNIDSAVRAIRKNGGVIGPAKKAREPKYNDEHAQYVCELQEDRSGATYDQLRKAALEWMCQTTKDLSSI